MLGTKQARSILGVNTGHSGVVLYASDGKPRIPWLLPSHAIRRPVKGDKPLSDLRRRRQGRKNNEEIEELIDRRKNQSPEDREKRGEKDRGETRQLMREVAAACNFGPAGIESLSGRDTCGIDGRPRPGYQAHLKEAKILPKFGFRARIDKDESQSKKLDIQ
jgi:hypothetical protein